MSYDTRAFAIAGLIVLGALSCNGSSDDSNGSGGGIPDGTWNSTSETGEDAGTLFTLNVSGSSGSISQDYGGTPDCTQDNAMTLSYSGSDITITLDASSCFSNGSPVGSCTGGGDTSCTGGASPAGFSGTYVVSGSTLTLSNSNGTITFSKAP